MRALLENLAARRQRSRLSRRDAARCGGPARASRAGAGARMRPRLLGLLVLVATLIIDQSHKLWMLFVYGISERQPVHVGPFLDLIVAWNPGISYSLLRATTEIERYLLHALALAAVVLLFVWLWRSRSRPTAFALGLIVGGALGN